MKAQKNNHYSIYILALLFLFALLPKTSFGGYFLDQNFGEGGVQTTSIGNLNDRGFAAALQADGKIVVVGTTEIGAVDKIAVLRYNADGSEDSGFNLNAGALEGDIGSFDDGANSVMVLENGNILVAGYSENADQEKEIVLVQLTSAGFLDVSFGGSGVARLEVSGEQGEAFGLAVDDQNRIVVGGTLESDSRKWAVAVRFLEDGILDSDGFGVNGYRKVEFTDDTDNTTAAFIKLQSDGKLLLGGTKETGTQVNGALFRLDENGVNVDSTFGADGLAVIESNLADSSFNGATVLSDDSVVVTGFTTSDERKSITTAKFNATGELDPAYGVDGVSINELASDSEAHDIAEKSDGSFVIVGEATGFESEDIVLIELDSNGNRQQTTVLTSSDAEEAQDSPDSTEDIVISPLEVADGFSLEDYELIAMQKESLPFFVDINGDNDSGQALLLTDDGNVIVAGFASDGNVDDIALISLATDSGPDEPGSGSIEDLPYLIGTIAITNVQRNSAMSGGVITANERFLDCDEDPDGENCLADIIERGVVFSITPFPSYRETTTDDGTTDGTDGTDDNGNDSNSVFPDFLENTSYNYDLVRRGQTSDGSGKGTFGSDINGITPDTVYYVRAYAVLSSTTTTNGTTAQEVIYGNQLSFRTNDACFIATAAFGSPLAPHIEVLSQFRDKYLKTTELGVKFVHAYYHFSPPLADFISQSSLMRFVVRLLLLPLVGFSYFMVNFSIQLKVILVLLTASSFYYTRHILARR